MNFAFEITLEDDHGEYATLYSFRRHGYDRSELSRFLTEPAIKSALDYGPLVGRLDDILDLYGPYDLRMDVGRNRWFRDEGDGVSALWAPIPQEDIEARNMRPPYPSLRLYCFRIDRVSVNHYENAPILIAGYGGIKTALELHAPENAELLTALNQVKYVKACLKERMQRGAVRVIQNGFLLEGSLTFDSPETP